MAVSAPHGPFLTHDISGKAVSSVSVSRTHFFSTVDSLGQYAIWIPTRHLCNVILMRWQQVLGHWVLRRVFLSGWRQLRAPLALTSAFHFCSRSFFFFSFFPNEMLGTDSLVHFSAEEELTAEQRTSLTGDADVWAGAWTCAKGCFQSAKWQMGIWLFGLGSSWIWSCWSLWKLQLPMQYLFPLPNVQF